MKKIAIVFGVLVFLISCNNKEKIEEEKFDPNEMRRYISRTHLDFEKIWELPESKKMLTFFTPDACVYPPDRNQMCDAKEVYEYFRSAYDKGIRNCRYMTKEIAGNNDMVTEIGLYTAADSTGTDIDAGKYMIVWTKYKGYWKYHRYMWNSNGTDSTKGGLTD